MAMPASAPSTPASKEPSVETGLPFSYSVVASPRYQTLPAAVLGVVVVGDLDGDAPERDLVAHDARPDAVGDQLRAVGDGDLDALLSLAVHPLASGREGEVGIGDLGPGGGEREGDELRW